MSSIRTNQTYSVTIDNEPVFAQFHDDIEPLGLRLDDILTTSQSDRGGNRFFNSVRFSLPGHSGEHIPLDTPVNFFFYGLPGNRTGRIVPA